MIPFEAVYGRNYNTPMSWENLEDHAIVDPDLLWELEEKMVKMRENLKDSQDRKKSYADKGKNHREFKVGDHVFLKVKAKQSSLKLGKCSK
jgi:hypothetical protein